MTNDPESIPSQIARKTWKFLPSPGNNSLRKLQVSREKKDISDTKTHLKKRKPMKKVFALLATATVLGLNIAPVSAQESGSDGVVQTQTQETIVTGDGNATYQRTTQRSTNVRGRDGRNVRSGDSAVIQDSSQVTDVFGNENYSEQVSEQKSRNVRYRNR